MIRNHNIKRHWRNHFIPAVDFVGAKKLTTTMTALTLNEAAPNTLNSSTIVTGQGSYVDVTALTVEINSTGLSGVSFLTTGGAGFAIRHFMPVPADMDVTQPTYARVWWTSGSTDTADTITWKLFRKALTPNTTAITGTINTALDTPIPQDTVPVATAYAICKTAPGKINANSFTQGGFTELELEMDAFAVGLAEIKIAVGVELLYVPLIGNETCAENTPDLPSDWA